MLTLGDQDQNSKDLNLFLFIQNRILFLCCVKTSSYNLRDNVINVNGVNDILVADVIVYPSQGFIS